MVNGEAGQLYTIEGIAAGLLMIMTAYLVVSATSVYTAGDTHISDMQLEQLGSDALRIMDTPENKTSPSKLEMIITSSDWASFNTTFLSLANSRTESDKDHIQYSASYTCRNLADNSTASYFMASSRNLTAGEHAVRVTKWVIVNKNVCGNNFFPIQDRAVLMEVLMWRD